MTRMRTILLTGATSGIGRAVAMQLAEQGHNLIIHGRSAAKCIALSDEIEVLGFRQPSYYVADFGNLDEVATLCIDVLTREASIDVLINNAGTGFNIPTRTSCDGFDETMQVNYLAPYLLTVALRPLLARRANAIVLNIVSDASAPLDESGYFIRHDNAGIAYGRSKLALSVATEELSRSFVTSGISVIAVHPGTMVPTPLTERLLAALPDEARLALTAGARMKMSVEESAAYIVETLGSSGTNDLIAKCVTGNCAPELTFNSPDRSLSKSLLNATEQQLAPFLTRVRASGWSSARYISTFVDKDM